MHLVVILVCLMEPYDVTFCASIETQTHTGSAAIIMWYRESMRSRKLSVCFVISNQSLYLPTKFNSM